MARPIKQGLDYYPIDVDFLKDLKVRKITKACGPVSPTILISLLSNIYREHGYFVAWDSDMPFLVADEVGTSEGAVSEVVNKALQVGFFNERSFKEFNILTSNGIQKQFVKAVERRTRIDMYAEYCLLDINNADYENIYLVNVNNNSINDFSNQQSKVNKKENESKKRSSGAVAPQAFDHEGVPYKCAKYLAERILQVNPKARVPKDDKGLYAWCVHIDRLLRIDNKPEDELRYVLAFAVKDSFWSTNILSTAAFREKYDQLYMKMTERNNRKTNGSSSEPKKNRFVNFDQRNHDWDAIEKQEREYLQRSLAESQG